jgi:hypothetical protein
MNKKVLPLIGLTFLVLGLISLLLSVILVPFTLYTFSSHKIALKPTIVTRESTKDSYQPSNPFLFQMWNFSTY